VEGNSQRAQGVPEITNPQVGLKGDLFWELVALLELPSIKYEYPLFAKPWSLVAFSFLGKNILGFTFFGCNRS